MTQFSYRGGVLFCEDVSINDMARNVGTPFYCYSVGALEQNYRSFVGAFDGLDKEICYAVKSNSNQAVIRLFANLGAGADEDAVTDLGMAVALLLAGAAEGDVLQDRDIVLDPSLVNVALLEEKRGSTEIGIGSNLLSSPWVNQLVRLNRCFVVERSGSARDRYNHSLRTAAYIQHVIGNGTAVWLAHREGRAKDGRDETAPALIRTLSNNCDPDTWNALNVVPVSISYEWDPCDAMKVNEVLHRMKYGSYEKAQGEDELSMWTGLAGQKGRVHIEFGEVVKWETHLEERKPERGMATKFDESLMGGMKIWPNQLLASEALGRETTSLHSEDKPSEMDRQAWNLRKRNIEDSLFEMGWSRELAVEAWCKMLAAPLELRRSLLND